MRTRTHTHAHIRTRTLTHTHARTSYGNIHHSIQTDEQIQINGLKMTDDLPHILGEGGGRKKKERKKGGGVV